MNTFFYDSFELIFIFVFPGVLFGAVYDVIRILRIARSDSKGSMTPKLFAHFKISYMPRLQNEKRKERLDLILVFIEDFVFCLFVALGELLLFYHLNDGVIRVWGLILSAIGFLIYKLSIGKIMIYMAKRIIYALRRLLYILVVIMFTPISLLARLGKHVFNPRKRCKKRKEVHDE